MKTTIRRAGTVLTVVALGVALVGCDGGRYDAVTGRYEAASTARSSAQGAPAGGAARGAVQPSYDQPQAYVNAYGQPQLAAPVEQDPAAYSRTFAPSPAPAVSPAADSRGSAPQAADPFARTPPAGGNLKPAIAGVSPPSGALEGGNEVLITGSDFANVQVIVGGQLAQVTSQSSNAVTILVPEGHGGPAPVVVTNRDGSYAVAGSAYSYM